MGNSANSSNALSLFNAAKKVKWGQLSAKLLVRPERFELPACCSGGNRSIQLSYGRVVPVYTAHDGPAIAARPAAGQRLPAVSAATTAPASAAITTATAASASVTAPTSTTTSAAPAPLGLGPGFINVERASADFLSI